MTRRPFRLNQRCVVVTGLLLLTCLKAQQTSADQKVSLTIDAEGNAKTEVTLRVDRPFNGRDEAPVTTVKAACPGKATIDCAGLKDQDYNVFVAAKGFAGQYQVVRIQKGRPEPLQIKVTLFKKRYVIIEYAINRKGGRSLTGPNVETGVCAVSHWVGLPYFDRDWQASQAGKDLYLESHRYTDRFGFAIPPDSTKYDELKEAPNPIADGKDQQTDKQNVYKGDMIRANKGLILFSRIEGDGIWGKGGLYGKLRVIDVVRDVPKGVRNLEAP
jgi:hypothetical protein